MSANVLLLLTVGCELAEGHQEKSLLWDDTRKRGNTRMRHGGKIKASLSGCTVKRVCTYMSHQEKETVLELDMRRYGCTEMGVTTG